MSIKYGTNIFLFAFDNLKIQDLAIKKETP